MNKAKAQMIASSLRSLETEAYRLQERIQWQREALELLIEDDETYSDGCDACE